MKTVKRWILYAFFVLGSVLFFLYYLFPAENVKGYIEHRLNREYPDFTLDIGRLKPALPLAVSLSDVSLFYLQSPFLTIDRVSVAPRLKSVLRPGLFFSYQGILSAGDLDGKMKVHQTTGRRSLSLDANLDGVELENVATAEALLHLKLSGLLDGKIKYKQSASQKSATALLTVSEGSITLAEPLFDIEGISFENVKAVVTSKNRQLTIKNFTLSGPQLNGTMTGSIMIQNPLGRSRLDLKVRVKPHEVFLVELREKLPPILFSPSHSKRGGYAFTIGGTFEQPDVSLN